jgi:beta-N-acetylhexosaminidase
MVLHCNGKMPEMLAVAAEAPLLAGVASRRAEAALAARKPPRPFEFVGPLDAFSKLMAGIWQPVVGAA